MGMLRRLRAKTAELAKLLVQQHTGPLRVSAALLCGCVVGCTPPLGLHFVLCAALAVLLRLNLPIMYAAANISIPPMIPLIGWASVELGTYVQRGHGVALTRADFTRESLPTLVQVLFWAWLRGGLILGAGIGLLAGTIAYVALKRRQARTAEQPPDPPQKKAPEGPSDISQALFQAAELFHSTHPRFRHYARAKYRLDPCYRALCARIPDGATVVDLGCGLGMLPIALALSGRGRRIVGVDWDAAKLEAGRTAAAGLSQVTLTRADAREFALPPCDAVTLVDVLHYYDAPVQTALLAKAAAALRPGGQIFVRETDPARGGGARLTRFFERLMVRLGWNRGPGVRYRPLAELRGDLERLGFRVEHVELAGATHPGNVLFCAQKESRQ